MDGPFCEDFLGGGSAFALPGASGSTAGVPAVVPLGAGSTATVSGSTAGVPAVVPLQPAVVPLELGQKVGVTV